MGETGMGPAVRANGRPPHRGWQWPANSLLGGLRESSRDRLLALGAMVQYAPDRVLMRELEDSKFVMVLLDGVVKATARAHNDREALLAVRMGGDLVGELGVVDGQPRSATVTTCGVVVARAVARTEFLDCLARDAQLASAVSRSVVAKLRVANSRRVDYVGSDAPTRLARVLHQIAMTYGEPDGDAMVIRWPLTQPELATLAGAAEPTVHKALRELRKAGVVTTGYRTIRINDVNQLKDIAYS